MNNVLVIFGRTANACIFGTILFVFVISANGQCPPTSPTPVLSGDGVTAQRCLFVGTADIVCAPNGVCVAAEGGGGVCCRSMVEPPAALNTRCPADTTPVMQGESIQACVFVGTADLICGANGACYRDPVNTNQGVCCRKNAVVTDRCPANTTPVIQGGSIQLCAFVGTADAICGANGACYRNPTNANQGVCCRGSPVATGQCPTGRTALVVGGVTQLCNAQTIGSMCTQNTAFQCITSTVANQKICCSTTAAPTGRCPPNTTPVMQGGSIQLCVFVGTADAICRANGACHRDPTNANQGVCCRSNTVATGECPTGRSALITGGVVETCTIQTVGTACTQNTNFVCTASTVANQKICCSRSTVPTGTCPTGLTPLMLNGVVQLCNNVVVGAACPQNANYICTASTLPNQKICCNRPLATGSCPVGRTPLVINNVVQLCSNVALGSACAQNANYVCTASTQMNEKICCSSPSTTGIQCPTGSIAVIVPQTNIARLCVPTTANPCGGEVGVTCQPNVRDPAQHLCCRSTTTNAQYRCPNGETPLNNAGGVVQLCLTNNPGTTCQNINAGYSCQANQTNAAQGICCLAASTAQFRCPTGQAIVNNAANVPQECILANPGRICQNINEQAVCRPNQLRPAAGLCCVAGATTAGDCVVNGQCARRRSPSCKIPWHIGGYQGPKTTDERGVACKRWNELKGAGNDFTAAAIDQLLNVRAGGAAFIPAHNRCLVTDGVDAPWCFVDFFTNMNQLQTAIRLCFPDCP